MEEADAGGFDDEEDYENDEFEASAKKSPQKAPLKDKTNKNFEQEFHPDAAELA